MKDCNIEQVRAEITNRIRKGLVGNSTTSIINALNPSQVLVRYSPSYPNIKTRQQAYQVASTKSQRINDFYRAPVTSVDPSYSDTVVINVHVPARLINQEVNRRLNTLNRDVSINEAANEFYVDGELYPSLEDALQHFSFQNIEDIIRDQKQYIPLTYLQDNSFSDTPTEEELLKQLPKSTLERIEQVRKVNPYISFNLTTNHYSNFDESTNRISIDLQEVQALSQRNGLPFKEVLDITLNHELEHAATAPAIREKYSEELRPLFEEVKRLQATNPFDDKYRFGWKDTNGLPYAFRNIYEFYAEANSNPFFIQYLKSIPTNYGTLSGTQSPANGNSSIYERFRDILDKILKALGVSLKKDRTLYDQVVAYKTEEFNLTNEQAAGVSIEDSGMTLREVHAANNTFSDVQVLLEEDTIMDTFRKNVPKVIKELREIRSKLYQEEKSRGVENIAERKQLSDIIDSLKGTESEENVKSLLQGLFSVSNIFESLHQKAIRVSKEEDSDEKLTKLYSISQVAQENEDYINLMSKLRNQIDLNTAFDDAFIDHYISQHKGQKSDEKLRRDGEKKLRSTERALKRILDYPLSNNKAIQSLIADQTPKLVTKLVYDYEAPTQTAEKSRIQKLIDEDTKLLATETRPTRQLAIKDRIKKNEALIKKLLLPENNTIEAILQGDNGDIGYFNLMVESATMSKDPLTSVLSAMVKEKQNNTIRSFQTTANQAQTELDLIQSKLGKGNVSILDFYKGEVEDLVTVYDSVTFDPKTKEYIVKSHEQKFLTSELSPEYYKDYNLLLKKKDDLEYQLNSTKTIEEDIPVIREELDSLYKEFNTFKKEYSQQAYLPEVYEMFDLYDEDLTFEGKTVSYRKYTSNLYRNRDAAQELRDRSEDAESYRQNHEIVIQFDQQIKDLQNPTGKEGIDLLISKQANRIKELSRKYKESVLTDKSREFWNAQRQNKIQTLGIDSQEFKVWDQENSTLTEDKNFYIRRREVLDRLSAARKVLVDKGILDAKKDTDWDTIIKITNKARDNARVIDGNVIPENEVQKVKEIEALEEDLKQDSKKVSSLSQKKQTRLSELYNNPRLSPEEQQEFKQLKQKQKDAKANKDLPEVKDYLAILKELGSLTVSAETVYYQERASLERGKAQESVRNSQEYKNIIVNILNGTEDYTIAVDKSIRYSEIDKQWYLDEQLPQGVEPKKITDGEQRILKDLTDKTYYQTQWFKDNHIEKTVYNPLTKKPSVEQVPIYIWQQKTPNPELFGPATYEPGYSYYTSKVKDEYINKDYKTTNDYIPYPKGTRYVSAKFQNLQKNPDKLRFYNYLSTTYLNSQVEGKRMGFKLPSGRKLNIENLKDFKDGGIMNSVKEHISRTLTFTEQDVDIIGSTRDNVYRKVIPDKLSSRIEAKDQTDDVLGNILQYAYYADLKKELVTVQAFAESLYDTLKAQDKTNLVTSSGPLNVLRTIKNAWKGVPNNEQSKLSTQTGVESNRTKSIRELTDKLLYGQMNKGQDLKVGPFNLTKLTGQLMGLTAHSVFSWNLFSPLKNSIGAAVQQLIEANNKLGYFSERDLAWAQKEVLAQSKNLTSDSMRLGNKSMLGQLLDRFDVVQGHTYNHIGQRLTWNAALKVKDVAFMTLLKEGSEYNLQLTQFLAMMNHYTVKENGKDIPLHKAYTIQNGSLELKPNITKQDGTPFTIDDENRFIRIQQKVNLELNGAYRMEEKNNSEKYLVGKVLNFMSQYLVSGVNRRYMAERFIEQDGSFQEGYYRTAWKFLFKNIKDYRLNYLSKWDSLTPAERHNVSKFTRELSIMVAFSLLLMAMGADDDDRFAQSDTKQFMIALMKGSLAEAQTFNPVNGGDDMVRRIQNPFIIGRTLQQMERIIAYSSMTILGDDDAYYQTSNNGHQEGDSKAMAAIMKLSGMGTSNVFFGDGEELLRRQEAILRIR